MGTADLQRGRETEQQTSDQSNSQCKQKDPRIDGGSQINSGVLRKKGDQHSGYGGSKENTQRTTTESQNAALNQLLPRDASACGSQRQPQSDFPSADKGAGQRQICDIQTGQQEDKSCSSEENKKGTLQS